jgi:long-chain acyl-CoA synthetase
VTPIGALWQQAELHPRDVAFVTNGGAWSYRRLATDAEHLAGALVMRGVRAGDRVALHMANVPEIAIAFYACFRIGAIAAPLNIRMKTAELRPLLQRLRPVLYLGQDALYPRVAAIEPDILAANARFVVGTGITGESAQPWARLVEGSAPGPIRPSHDTGTPAVLLTTSGTTGQPKFVSHTAATLGAIAESLAHIGFDGKQTLIHTLPMVHAAGLWAFLGAVHFGAPMVLLERFDPDAVLDAIEAYRGSFMAGLPFMFAELLQTQQQRPRDVAPLQQARVAGDACPLETQETFQSVFGIPLRSFWAATEAGLFSHGLRPGPVTRVPPDTQVRLVDDAGRAVARGDVGEMLVRGPGVFNGYWAGPGRIESAPEEGWYRTGDLMRQGDGDELWFVSRKKELIIRGGSNITPAEVEQVLVSHPAVRDAAVLGMPDPMLGQRVAALVQLADDADIAVLEDIGVHARALLADYKVPELLKVVSAIPRNALGKIARGSLPALLG